MYNHRCDTLAVHWEAAFYLPLQFHIGFNARTIVLGKNPQTNRGRLAAPNADVSQPKQRLVCGFLRF